MIAWSRCLTLSLMAAFTLAGGNADAAQERRPEGPNRLTGFIGAGVALVPVYEGANDYKALALPAFDLRYGRVYANFRDGVGIDLIDTERFEAGIGATYVRGRRAKDSPEGVGKVKNAVGSRLFARYFLNEDITLTTGLTHAFGGTDGTLVDLTLGYRFKPAKHLILAPAVSATWADGKHMRSYFGIDERQAAQSDLPMFDAGSGIKDVSASLTGILALNHHWHASATAGLTRYFGDAADSPINEHKWQPTVMLGIGYRF